MAGRAIVDCEAKLTERSYVLNAAKCGLVAKGSHHDRQLSTEACVTGVSMLFLRPWIIDVAMLSHLGTVRGASDARRSTHGPIRRASHKIAESANVGPSQMRIFAEGGPT
jgi:hypothetical protein